MPRTSHFGGPILGSWGWVSAGAEGRGLRCVRHVISSMLCALELFEGREGGRILHLIDLVEGWIEFVAASAHATTTHLGQPIVPERDDG